MDDLEVTPHFRKPPNGFVGKWGYTGMHAKGLYLSGELMINFHKPLKRGIPVYPQMANIYWQKLVINHWVLGAPPLSDRPKIKKEQVELHQTLSQETRSVVFWTAQWLWICRNEPETSGRPIYSCLLSKVFVLPCGTWWDLLELGFNDLERLLFFGQVPPKENSKFITNTNN